MPKAVICLTDSEDRAANIVDDLRTAGFASNDVSVLLPDRSESHEFAHEHHTKAPEGAATGAGTGGVLGGALGWLVGIGALAIPGLGPFIAAGPLLAGLSGAAVGAAVGGLTGALIGMGIPEYEAKLYEGKVRAGRILISIHTINGDELARAKKIFEQAGAEEVSVAAEKKSA